MILSVCQIPKLKTKNKKTIPIYENEPTFIS